MKYTGPKVRRARRIGLAITPKDARIMKKKPGISGDSRARRRQARMSDFAKQLNEKQKLRFQYNVSEKQMERYMAEANRRTGNSVENLMQELETRLDAFVLRSGFARTIYQARQIVNHGHFTVNGKKVNIPSFQLKPGMVVAVKEKSKKLEMLRDSLSGSSAPVYIEVNKDDMTAKLVAVPRRDEVPVIADIPLVIEYYSR
jgi:small subunit ribosomal protein S4